eukprot:6177076-Pleurochrysis_carterae.AAC.3
MVNCPRQARERFSPKYRRLDDFNLLQVATSRAHLERRRGRSRDDEQGAEITSRAGDTCRATSTPAGRAQGRPAGRLGDMPDDKQSEKQGMSMSQARRAGHSGDEQGAAAGDKQGTSRAWG